MPDTPISESVKHTGMTHSSAGQGNDLWSRVGLVFSWTGIPGSGFCD